MTRKAPVRLVSMTEVKSSSLMRISSVSLVMPAFATKHLHRSVGSFDLCKGGVNGSLIGHVGLDAEDSFRQRRLAAVRHGHLVAVGQEGLGDGQSDASVAAGDQDAAAG